MNYATCHGRFEPWALQPVDVFFQLLMQAPLYVWLPTSQVYKATSVWGWSYSDTHGYLETWTSLKVIKMTSDHLHFRIPELSSALQPVTPPVRPSRDVPVSHFLI